MEKKGQGAIEYLLIIGAAVIIAVIVISLMMTLSQQGTGAADDADVEGIYGDLDAYKQESLSKVTLTRGQPLTGGSLGVEILRKDGTSITDNSILEQAYAAGEIVIYKDGTEVSIVEKEDSARFMFETLYDWGRSSSDDYIMVPAGACGTKFTPASPILNKYVKIITANDPSFVGKSYKITSNIINCPNGWINPPYPAAADFTINPNLVDTIRTGNKISGWTWGFYDYEINHGSSAGTTQIGIEPSTGTITGISGNITVDYYSQK
jgi:hypothetical protein